jgi:hypothetical protein
MPVLTFSPKQGLYEKRHRQEQIVPEKPSQEIKTSQFLLGAWRDTEEEKITVVLPAPFSRGLSLGIRGQQIR